ncbi:hypothetical protein Hdeb2414_s0011g00362661 [Helianthus debilis subsp. tardiflorus]
MHDIQPSKAHVHLFNKNMRFVLPFRVSLIITFSHLIIHFHPQLLYLSLSLSLAILEISWLLMKISPDLC